MFRSIANSFKDGLHQVKEHPQVVYTVFLLIVIPVAFLVSSQQFLNVSLENQERLERSRIGIMHDVFVLFARDNFDNPLLLKEKLSELVSQNETIAEFTILIREQNTISIVASALQDGNTILRAEDDDFLYKTAGSYTDSSLIFEEVIDGIRYWKAVRAISDDNGEVVGFIFTLVSMAQLDALIAENVLNAYIILFGIIILIFILLVRHARIIDYTTLYRRLEGVDRMKDDFISMAAHELRTPLTLIRGYVDVLKGEKRATKYEREYFEKIDTSAQRLNGLVEDILDVSRLQQGRMSFNKETMDIYETLTPVVNSFERAAREKGLLLSYKQGVPTYVSFDPKRLEQVLINILGNAVKYTQKGGVTVSVNIERNRVHIRVSDTGIGISAEDQNRISEKFFRVRSEETEEITGTGLGLWITRQIVEHMNGSFSIESIKGKGTDVIVSFPIIQIKQ